MKKIICIVLALSLVFSFSVSAFATTVTSVTIPDLKSGWTISSSGSITAPSGYTSSWFVRLLDQIVKSNLSLGDKGDTYIDQTIFGYVHSIYDELHNIQLGLNGTSNTSVASRLSSFYTFLNSINNNVGLIESDIRNNTTSVNGISTKFDTFLTRLGSPSTGNSIFSYLADLKISNAHIMSAAEHLEEVLADDDDKALKDDSKDNQLKAQDEFFGDGANSVSSDNLGSLSSLVSAFRSFLGDDIGLGNLDLAGWEEITSSDDPWQFFTDGDAVAESMGVSASAVSSPDFPDTPQGGGGGGDTPDIPDTPPDEDEFPNDGKTYLHLINVSYCSDFYFESSDYETDGSDLSDDVFLPVDDSTEFYFDYGVISFDGVRYYCDVILNGLYFRVSGTRLPSGSNEFNVDFSNNVTVEFVAPVLAPSTASYRDVYFNYTYVPPVSNSAPRLLVSACPDPNAVVTSYYEDNKNALWGWLN